MFDKAIICYEKILKINPNSARAYFNIAVMYDKLKSPKNAIKNYKMQQKSNLTMLMLITIWEAHIKS